MTISEAQFLVLGLRSLKASPCPTRRGAAADIILQVRENRWRILVGEDAHAIDRLVG